MTHRICRCYRLHFSLSVIWRSIIFECPAIYVFYVAPMFPRDSEASEIIFSRLQFNELDPNIARWSTIVSYFRFQPRVNVVVSSMLLVARLSDHRVAYYRFRRPACYRIDRYQERVSSQTDKPHVSRKNCSCRARKHSLTHARFILGKFNELFHGLHAPLLVTSCFVYELRLRRKLLFTQLFSEQRKNQLTTPRWCHDWRPKKFQSPALFKIWQL